MALKQKFYSTELKSKGIFQELLDSVKNIKVYIKLVLYSSVRKKYINILMSPVFLYTSKTTKQNKKLNGIKAS